MTSILYKNPRFYNLMILFMHGKNLSKRYKLISKEIKSKNKVLDIACGTGTFSKYMKNDCNYMGIDLNKKFISYAKGKGRNVKYMNIFDFKKYPKNIDVAVICDLLHHITPNHGHFLKKLSKIVKKKIIISEPKKHNFFNRLAEFLDSDGINDHKNYNWFRNSKKTKSFFKSCIPNKVKINSVGSDYVVVYDLS